MGRLAALLVHLGRILTATTRYGAWGGTCGALGIALALWLDVNPYLAFFVGFWLPMGPLFWWYTRPAAVREFLETIRAWQAAGLITQAQYRQLREQALRWYGQRIFGGPEPPPEPPPQGQGTQ
jgi:hypothetical protein